MFLMLLILLMLVAMCGTVWPFTGSCSLVHIHVFAKVHPSFNIICNISTLLNFQTLFSNNNIKSLTISWSFWLITVYKERQLGCRLIKEIVVVWVHESANGIWRIFASSKPHCDLLLRNVSLVWLNSQSKAKFPAGRFEIDEVQRVFNKQKFHDAKVYLQLQGISVCATGHRFL